MDSEEFDLTLVGNGAVACALALRFHQEHRSARIAIVGPGPRPGAASMAAGAMLGVFGELGAGSLASPPACAKFEASLAATALWQPHLDALNARLIETPPVRIHPGTYVVSRPDEASNGLDEDFEAVLAALASASAPFHTVDPRRIPGLSPPPRGLPQRALFLPEEGTVASRHLHRAYDEAFFRTSEITAIDDEVVAVQPSGDARRATTLVDTASGRRLRTHHVVLAAGSHTQRLVDQLELQAKIPRLVYGIGVALILRSPVALPEHVVRAPNRGVLGSFYSVPYGAPYGYIGATTTMRATAEPLPRADAVHGLLHAAVQQLHRGLAGAVIHKTLVGYRPTTLDTYPLLGHTSIEGLWLATGTRRDGLHLSPLLAQEMTAAIASGAQPLAGQFVPERALLLDTGPRAAVLERTAAQLLRAHAGRDQRLPSGEEPPSAGELRARLEATYQACGLASTEHVIPVELLELYRDGHAQDNLELLLARPLGDDGAN
jgi:glycine oxidase